MARILVLGSSNTDMTVRLPRLPAPGQTVLGGALLTGHGGKGANQAVAAARAGAAVTFVTAVGDDPFGRAAVAAYRDEGIDLSHVKVLSDVPSGVALIFVGEGGENMIGVASGANGRLEPSDVDRIPEARFASGGLLLVAGLEVPLATVKRAVERAGRSGMTVVLNPAPAAEGLLASGVLEAVDVLTPNRVELGMLSGRDTSTPEAVVEASRALIERGPRAVVVTLGAEGCLVTGAGANAGGSRRIAPHVVEAVDTVGAGDAFTAALAVALAEGRGLADAAEWAAAAGALAATRPGAQAALPDRAAIDRLAATRSGPSIHP